MDQEFASVLVPEKMSWATATRSIRKYKTRIEKIGGSRVDTEPTVWGLDDDDDCFYYHSWRNNVVIAFGTLSSFVQVWNLLWTGEEAREIMLFIGKPKGRSRMISNGEEAMKKGIPILKRAGFESVEDLPRTAVGFSSKA